MPCCDDDVIVFATFVVMATDRYDVDELSSVISACLAVQVFTTHYLVQYIFSVFA